MTTEVASSKKFEKSIVSLLLFLFFSLAGLLFHLLCFYLLQFFALLADLALLFFLPIPKIENKNWRGSDGFYRTGQILVFGNPCQRQTMRLALNSTKHPHFTPRIQKMDVLGAFKVSGQIFLARSQVPRLKNVQHREFGW